MSDIKGLMIRVPAEMIQHWSWFLALGIGLLLLGIAAVFRSVKATVISMLFFGWLLVLAGGIEAAQALLVGMWAGFFLHLVAAVLFLVITVCPDGYCRSGAMAGLRSLGDWPLRGNRSDFSRLGLGDSGA